MIFHNNPAGRLYSLLERLRETADHTSIATAWAQILEVPEEMVRVSLGDVAQLVSRIDAAVAVPGRERIAAPVNRHRRQWLEATFPLRHSFADPIGQIKPDEESYETLGFVAEYLAAVAPDGAMPSDEQRSDLREKLEGVIEEVRADEDLPKQVAHLMLDRLSDVETALRHIDIGGSEAIQRATEVLLGATFAATVTDQKAAKAKVTRRVMAIAGVIWVVFTSGPTAQKSLDAWAGVVNELTAGSAEVQPMAHDAGNDPRYGDTADRDQNAEAAR